ncbi:hypothetical protein BO71DRAFT_437980 [Aspergillus ellipticus CBS 707.79]|uniref:Carboxylesterase type B domain-containing protein n=1 Tax=Aspergillus ellipticus CBS 707.79 TaxID=1448320 RepID=A0A319DMB9_9EURO|nr:hypothetical protein BO71DRAFT_437980 [Aspergillus ellipticus CBS 707.79]
MGYPALCLSPPAKSPQPRGGPLSEPDTHRFPAKPLPKQPPSNQPTPLTPPTPSPQPLITGSNTNEGAGFVSFTPTGPGSSTLFNLTESVIACPVAQEVKNRNRVGLPTYRYQYAGNFSNISPVSWFGAYHSAELPLLFGTHSEYRGPSTQFEWDVSYAMEALWLSFAEDPSRGPVRLAIGDAPANPNNGSYFAWPQFEQGEDDMLLFAEGGTLMQLVGSGRIDDYCTGL